MRAGRGRGRGGCPRNPSRPSHPPDQQRISFLSLPAEIRNEIYKAAIRASRRKIYFPLGMTCSQVYQETNAMRFLNTRLTIDHGFEGETQNSSPETSRQRLTSVCMVRSYAQHIPPLVWPPGPNDITYLHAADRNKFLRYMPLAFIPEIEVRLLEGPFWHDRIRILLRFPSNKNDSPSIEVSPYRKPGFHDGGEEHEIDSESRETVDPTFNAMRKAVLREWAIWQTREGDKMRFSHGLFEAIMQHAKPAHWDSLCFDYEQPWY